jgi:tRNA threonylcarbamoyladenosine biosynthesis protein TsaE
VEKGQSKSKFRIMTKILLKTEKDTQLYAKTLVGKLKGGEIIALEGDLGAGKTTLTQYLAKEYGMTKVTSPTFVLMKVYDIKLDKIKHLVHVDCYRLDDFQELFYLGIEEYLNKTDTIVIIEWADKIKKYLKKFKKLKWIKIKIKGEEREIIVK